MRDHLQFQKSVGQKLSRFSLDKTFLRLTTSCTTVLPFSVAFTGKQWKPMGLEISLNKRRLGSRRYSKLELLAA
jgi:hypothetical protein